MGRKASKSGGEEGGGHSVGLWYVSFSDMITLLLSFFVMLATFSSYDDDSKDKFAGAVRYIYNNSVFPGKGPFKDSFLPPAEVQTDRTEGGSEMPTSEDLGFLRNPRALPWISESDAYRDRKALYVPSGRLFYGKGSRLSDEGRRDLLLIAEFLQRSPCQIVVGEVQQGQGAGDAAAADMRLDRAWAVVEFLTGEAKLPAGRFNVAAAASASPGVAGRLAGQPAVQIALLSGSVFK